MNEVRAAEKRRKERERWRKWNAANPGVASRRMKLWKQNNPEKVKQHARNRRIRKYGLEPEQFTTLLEEQGDRCAVCRVDRPTTVKGWVIDHCHDTGRVRGILCHHCNVVIGMAGDRQQVLRAAADYLEKHDGRERREARSELPQDADANPAPGEGLQSPT